MNYPKPLLEAEGGPPKPTRPSAAQADATAAERGLWGQRVGEEGLGGVPGGRESALVAPNREQDNGVTLGRPPVRPCGPAARP